MGKRLVYWPASIKDNGYIYVCMYGREGGREGRREGERERGREEGRERRIADLARLDVG